MTAFPKSKMTTLTLTTMTTAPIQGTLAIRDGAYETRDFFLLLIRTSYAYPLRRGGCQHPQGSACHVDKEDREDGVTIRDAIGSWENNQDCFVQLWRRLEMLRSEWNRRYGEGNDPIIINSGFRSEAVNNVIGGVATSNHLTGCAADIRVAGMEQLIRYATILLDVSDQSREDFDELLLEYSPRGGYWLHFAVKSKGNRRKVRLIQA